MPWKWSAQGYLFESVNLLIIGHQRLTILLDNATFRIHLVYYSTCIYIVLTLSTLSNYSNYSLFWIELKWSVGAKGLPCYSKCNLDCMLMLMFIKFYIIVVRFQAILGFAEATGMPLNIHFETPGRYKESFHSFLICILPIFLAHMSRRLKWALPIPLRSASAAALTFH